MNEQSKIRRLVRESIEHYNRYRSPEATARLIEDREDEITVEFEGAFCESCGIVDWIEDLAYIMIERGLDARLIAVKDTDDDYVKIGVFRINKTRYKRSE